LGFLRGEDGFVEIRTVAGVDEKSWVNPPPAEILRFKRKTQNQKALESRPRRRWKPWMRSQRAPVSI